MTSAVERYACLALPDQREVTDSKTREWVMCWPSELEPVNDFRRSVDLPPLARETRKRNA
jgi:hypothetical protein